MCLREVVTMDKNRGYKAYNKFVSELLVDESIREEVIEKKINRKKRFVKRITYLIKSNNKLLLLLIFIFKLDIIYICQMEVIV